MKQFQSKMDETIPSIIKPSFNDEDITECYDNDENLDAKSLEKTRERNREHAKKTRLRKKALLENMKGRLLELQNEVFI